MVLPFVSLADLAASMTLPLRCSRLVTPVFGECKARGATTRDGLE